MLALLLEVRSVMIGFGRGASTGLANGLSKSSF